MDKPSYKMVRDYYNRWKAETVFDLGDKRRLTITTKKYDKGPIKAFASVATIAGDWATHKLFSDYARTIVSEKRNATEKAIRDVHERALAMFEQVKAEALAHYQDGERNAQHN